MIESRGNRAVIYVRESMDKWGDERAVERFEQECRQLCKARGLDIVKVLRDNDVRASNGNKGDGFAEVKRMLRERETDYIVIPVVDRFFRSPRDLEDVIDICLTTGAALVAASGEIDLSHDQGRLVARLLVSVARAETERKGERQRKAYLQSVRAGNRRVAGQRPFGWDAVYVEDAAGNRQRTYVENEKEAKAIRWAADHLLGGGSVAAAVRRWTEDGITGVQNGRRISRTSFMAVMRNPRIGGLTCLPAGKGERHGEIIGRGNWEPIIPEETWRAVDALLGDPSRKPSRGTRTLLGGIARCPCGTPVTSAANHRGYRVYRCNPEQRREGAVGPHVSVKAEPVNEFVERVALEVLSSDELAGIVTLPPEVDTVGLRREAKSIRDNLDEMAADRALGLVTRAQMLKATEKGQTRLDEIAAELAGAAGAGALAPFMSAPHRARELWAGLDLSRRREVIRALGNVTLLSPKRGSRVFDPRNVQIESPAGKDLATDLADA